MIYQNWKLVDVLTWYNKEMKILLFNEGMFTDRSNTYNGAMPNQIMTRNRSVFMIYQN